MRKNKIPVSAINKDIIINTSTTTIKDKVKDILEFTNMVYISIMDIPVNCYNLRIED